MSSSAWNYLLLFIPAFITFHSPTMICVDEALGEQATLLKALVKIKKRFFVT
jgi:hypothetical protein